MELSKFQLKLAEELGLLSAEGAAKAADPLTTTSAVSTDSVGLSKDIPDKFIDLMVDESTLLKNIRLFRTNKPSGDLAKLDVIGNITEQATENGTSTETRRTTTTSVPYVNKKLRAQFDITTELGEDNIEGESGISTILGSLMKAVGNDVETLAIQGDDSVGGSTDFARLQKANDGFNVLTAAGTGTHQLGVANAQISWRMLSDMIAALPTRYRGGNWKSNYRFIMSPNAKIRLMNEAQTRATGLGDGVWVGNDNLAPLGIQVMEVPLIPVTRPPS